MKLLAVAAAVFLINLPFGYWRSRVPARSRLWFLSIHLPVPLVIALRVLSGLGWQFVSFPVLVGAFFLGQFVGGRLPRLGFGRRLATSHGMTANTTSIRRYAAPDTGSRVATYSENVRLRSLSTTLSSAESRKPRAMSPTPTLAGSAGGSAERRTTHPAAANIAASIRGISASSAALSPKR